MKTSPKLLPWLARKAGLSQEKAEALWRETLADESNNTQYASNPDLFSRRVLECFQQVAAQQSAQCASRQIAPQSPSSKGSRNGGTPVAIRFALA